MTSFFDYLDGYQPVSEAATQALAAILTPLAYPKNHFLHRAGDTCHHVYFIVTGLARIFYYRDGKDITNHFVCERDIVAAMDSLYSGTPSFYSIELLEDCTLIAIRYQTFEALYSEFRELESIDRLLAIECYLKENERNRSFQMHTAKERYVRLTETHPDLLHRVNLGHIASYIGVTQVQLSRIRAELITL